MDALKAALQRSKKATARREDLSCRHGGLLQDLDEVDSWSTLDLLSSDSGLH